MIASSELGWGTEPLYYEKPRISSLVPNGHMEDGRQDPDDRMDGDDDGGRPLFGIPVILKDNTFVRSAPGTWKSWKRRCELRAMKASFSGLEPPRATEPVVVGMRTTAPFNDGRPGFIALGMPTGGSSSGPGIAVSANLVTVGVGTETSGSILSPSGQNMDVGIKPTLGLVARVACFASFNMCATISVAMSALILMGGLWAVLAGEGATACKPGERCALCKPCKGLICNDLL